MSLIEQYVRGLDKKCKHCGCTKGSHSAIAYYSEHYDLYVPYDYCPGHEGRMDWGEGPGTTFEPIEEEETDDN